MSRVLMHQKLFVHHLDLVCPLRSAPVIQKYYFKKDYLKDSKVLSREVRAQDTMLECLWSSRDREKVRHTQQELSEGEAEDSRTEKEDGEEAGGSQWQQWQ